MTPDNAKEYLSARSQSMPSGCREWQLSTNWNGYGQAWGMGRTVSAHRAAYAAWVGPIPDGLDVLHRCDNPACINPDHLFLGTHTDNMRDMFAKGRYPFRKEGIMYSIEQNVPIPLMRHGGSQFPLSELSTGESFFVPGGEDIVKTRAKLTAAIANHYRRKKSQRRFTVQTQIEDGVKGMRVWCLSNPEEVEAE